MRTPRLHLGQTSITLETSIGISLESRPPWGFLLLGRMCLYTRLIPSTTILFLEGSARSTLENRRCLGVPRSSPAITSTWSSLRICMVGSLHFTSLHFSITVRSRSGEARRAPDRGPQPGRGSDDFGREADDLHELAVTQLAGDRAEDARAPRISLGVDQHHGVAIELDVGAVGAPGLIPSSHDDAPDHVAGLDVAPRRGFLDAGDDRVAKARGAPLVERRAAAEDLDAHHFLGSRVVGHVKPGLHLDHGTDTLALHWPAARGRWPKLFSISKDRKQIKFFRARPAGRVADPSCDRTLHSGGRSALILAGQR